MWSFRLVIAAILTLALASASASVSAATTETAGLSAVAGKPAKAKALKKCQRLKNASKRKTCRKRVNRRYAKPAKPEPEQEPTIVDVRDDYFSPDIVSIPKGGSIKWVWDDLNHDPHNIDLSSAPSGVEHSDFQTSTAPAVQYEFTRRFEVPGTYVFACSLHFLMTLTVEVRNEVQ